MPHEPDPAPHEPGPAPPAPPPGAVDPAPSGTPYALLARNRHHRWWRPVVGTAVILGTGLAVQLAVGLVLAALGQVPEGGAGEGSTLFLAAALVGLAVMGPVVLATARLVQRRPAGSVSSVAGRLRWTWMLLCTGVALATTVLGLIVRAVTVLATGTAEELAGSGGAETGSWVGWDAFWPVALMMLVLVPLQSAAEEYVFRGWFLQAFGAFIRNPLPAMLVGGVLFSLLHGYTGWGLVWVFSLALAAAWATVRTGGLEAAIALHAVNNGVIFLLAAAVSSGAAPLEQGAVPWEILPGAFLQIALFLAVVVPLAPRMGVRTAS